MLTTVFFRGLRVYLQSLLGFLLASGTGFTDAVGIQMPHSDFFGVVLTSMSFAVAPAFITVLQNVIEVLAQRDLVRRD